MKKTTYLDYAAATPMDDLVFAAMEPYFRDKFYNPSSNNMPARQVRQDLAAARATIAQALGVRPSEVIFTAGGTEANNLAIHGVAEQHKKSHIVTTSLEHDSVLQPASHYSHTEVAPNVQGIVDVERIISAVKENTVLVSVMYANNEVGTIQPIKRISAALENIRRARRQSGNTTPLYFHTDAAQAVNYLDINAHRLGVDMMTINGGKIYGPKQSGALYVRAGIDLTPLVYGGGQERGVRSGTENVAGCIGLAVAIEQSQALRKQETARLTALQDRCITELDAIQGVQINGSVRQRLPNNIHITISGSDNERLLYSLEERGFICATGSACSASKEESSHVLRAMGLPDEIARASIRVTFGRQTTAKDIEGFLAALKALVDR